MELIKFIENYHPLNEQAKKALLINCKEQILRRGEHFLKAGERCRAIGFVTKGILRNYFYDQEGNEYTKYFIKKGQLATNLKSFNEEVLSAEFLIAETETTLVTITKPGMAILSEKIQGWDLAVKKIIETKLLEKLTTKTNMLNQDATVRYLTFMETNPEIVNNVALGHVASYLGITQSTLSRIRKKIIQY